MRLKISYSIINLWLKGDISAVVEALNGHWQEQTPAMLYGIEKHKEWENYVNETGKLPDVFGGGDLINPKTEQYRKLCLVDDWLWLSGIADLQYGNKGEVLVDYKTGKSTANQYSNSLQVGCYKVLFPEAKYFKFLCYNQHTEKVTTSIIRLSDKVYQDAIDRILTVGCDIRATLENLGMSDFDNVNVSSRSNK